MRYLRKRTQLTPFGGVLYCCCIWWISVRRNSIWLPRLQRPVKTLIATLHSSCEQSRLGHNSKEMAPQYVSIKPLLYSRPSVSLMDCKEFYFSKHRNENSRAALLASLRYVVCFEDYFQFRCCDLASGKFGRARHLGCPSPIPTIASRKFGRARRAVGPSPQPLRESSDADALGVLLVFLHNRFGGVRTRSACSRSISTTASGKIGRAR